MILPGAAASQTRSRPPPVPAGNIVCPLANASEHLALLAKRTTMTLGGDSAEAMVTLHARAKSPATPARERES